MWRTAAKRFMPHVCLRNPGLLWNLSLLSLPEAWGPWERQQLVKVASSLQNIELCYPSFGLQAIDCDLGCLVDATAASQWRIVEIQLLASVGLKRGCRPNSSPCLPNVTHGRKEVYATCCLRNPGLLWNLILHSLREGWALSSSTLRQLWIMVASCLQKIELWYPSFGLPDIHCDLPCLVDATAASQSRIVEIEFFASAEKKRVRHVLFQESIPTILCKDIQLIRSSESW